MSERVRGTVKWFNGDKGYGFITQPNGPDLFVHYSAIQGSGFRTLEDGVEVEFEITDGKKGKQASNVVVLSEF
ncbi:MAG: cold shock domain-containing protein [Gammaproteobacteria bacterium]|jgi:CspA family cold shock protein|nr:cold shock domain-containing protein [Gammaproteobacteria bacterium]